MGTFVAHRCVDGGVCFFFYYLIAGPAYYCIRDLPRFRQCFAGLFTVYALGFIGYTFLPAGGPHRYLEFAHPLTGGWITWTAKPILDDASNAVDAFPSIHVAVSLYLLVFDRWYYRRRFWRMLATCVALVDFQPFISATIIVWTWWRARPLRSLDYGWPPVTKKRKQNMAFPAEQNRPGRFNRPEKSQGRAPCASSCLPVKPSSAGRRLRQSARNRLVAP